MVEEKRGVAINAQNDIMNPDMDKREFKITIGIRSYWITKEELKKYLTERKRPGIDLVALRDGLLLLPTQCQEIAHRSVIEESERVQEGQWQCDTGIWHKPGVRCFCNIDMIETEDGTMQLIDKSEEVEPKKLPSFRSDNLKLPQIKSF